MQQQQKQSGKVHVQENSLYDSQNQLQRRLQDFAEDRNIKLLREEMPDWEDRLEYLKYIIEDRYAQFANRTSR